MATINVKIVTDFMSKHSIGSDFGEELKKYSSHEINIENMDQEDLFDKISRVNNQNKKSYSMDYGQGAFDYSTWKKGELKLFAWIILFYCFVENLSLSQLVVIISFRTKRISYSSRPSSSDTPFIDSGSKLKVFSQTSSFKFQGGVLRKRPF